MKYISLFFTFIIINVLHAMQINEGNIKAIGKFSDSTGYWMMLNDGSVITVANAQDKITCTKQFANSGIWYEEEQPFPQWWFDTLGMLYKNRQVQQHMEKVIEGIKRL